VLYDAECQHIMEAQFRAFKEGGPVHAKAIVRGKDVTINFEGMKQQALWWPPRDWLSL